MDPDSPSTDRRLTGILPPTSSSSSSSPSSLDTAAEAFSPRVEGYDVLERLGEGGMGTVWRAVQTSTRREVAIKLLSRGVFNDSARRRFDREVELTARLAHPHIARIYDSGLRHGQYFYAMELIHGRPLDEYVRAQRLDQRDILRLMCKVALAVQHAHQSGVIHRDLKPSNILVDEQGEPHLLDFGLAKTLADEVTAGPAISLDADVLGTPEFMSPEQATGAGGRLDTRTDVYSLGATLFLLLTGKSPHDASGTKLDVIRRISTEDARRPRALSKGIDRELEAVLLKALARDPNDRYRSAGELAEDVDRYLNGDPVLARTQTLGYFVRKKVRKHWLPLSITSAVLAMFAAMGVWSYMRVAERSAEAERQRADAININETDKRVGDFMSRCMRTVAMKTPAGTRVTVEQRAREAMRMLDAGWFKDFPLDDAAAHHLVATELDTVGLHKEAIDYLRTALAIRRRNLRPDHPDLAPTINRLGSALIQDGQRDEGMALLREAIEIRRRNLPTGAFGLVANLDELGALLRARQKLAEAEQLDREAVELARRSAPQLVHYSLVHLGLNLYDQGRLTDAEPLFREVFSEYEGVDLRRYADPGPCIASTRYLAYILDEQGRTTEAEAFYRRALNSLAADPSSSPGEKAWTLLRFGELLARQPTRADESEALFREAVEVYASLGPTEFEHRARAFAALAGQLKRAGKTDELAKLCDGPVARYVEDLDRKRRSAKPYTNVAHCLNYLAAVYESAGRTQQAQNYRAEVESISSRRQAAATSHAARELSEGVR